jgi:hypothetical protein
MGLSFGTEGLSRHEATQIRPDGVRTVVGRWFWMREDRCISYV